VPKGFILFIFRVRFWWLSGDAAKRRPTGDLVGDGPWYGIVKPLCFDIGKTPSALISTREK
jgi:hypothetical protein